MDDRNHQTFRHGAGLRSSAPQMGRRTYFRMARSLSQAGKGFRSDNRQRRCLGVRCAHPNPHAATRKSLKSNAIIMSQTLRQTQPSPSARSETMTDEQLAAMHRLLAEHHRKLAKEAALAFVQQYH